MYDYGRIRTALVVSLSAACASMSIESTTHADVVTANYVNDNLFSYRIGHMPDLEKRLLAQGFTKGKSIWLDAWMIPDATIAPASGLAAGTPSPADFLGKLLEDNPGIMTTIQQLGSLLESLRAAGEGQPVE